jgi:hypothetical protein
MSRVGFYNLATVFVSKATLLKVMSCCSVNKWCHLSKGNLHAESRCGAVNVFGLFSCRLFRFRAALFTLLDNLLHRGRSIACNNRADIQFPPLHHHHYLATTTTTVPNNRPAVQATSHRLSSRGRTADWALCLQNCCQKP